MINAIKGINNGMTERKFKRTLRQGAEPGLSEHCQCQWRTFQRRKGGRGGEKSSLGRKGMGARLTDFKVSLRTD